MYYRYRRISFYLGSEVFWLRVRDKEMRPRGFLIKVGKEI